MGQLSGSEGGRLDGNSARQLWHTTAVQDRTGGSGRPLKAGRLWDGMERFQDEVSMSGLGKPVQVIREPESVVPAAVSAAGFASDREATWSTPGK